MAESHHIYGDRLNPMGSYHIKNDQLFCDEIKSWPILLYADVDVSGLIPDKDLLTLRGPEATWYNALRKDGE